jgi:hypothetical protein
MSDSVKCIIIGGLMVGGALCLGLYLYPALSSRIIAGTVTEATGKIINGAASLAVKAIA